MAFSTHMLLKKDAENETVVSYLVVSLDFNPEGDWQPIGRLTIKKAEKTFAFEPLNAWAIQGITVTPQDPSTAEELRDSSEYWMAWRGRIRAWAERLIELEQFPEAYPS